MKKSCLLGLLILFIFPLSASQAEVASSDPVCVKLRQHLKAYESFNNLVVMRIGRLNDEITAKGNASISTYREYLLLQYKDTHGGQDCK